MTTVPTPGTPAPANNAKTLTLQSDPNLYVRPTAGGNASGDAAVAPGAVPGSGAYSAPSPAGTGTPDMGHGATQIVAQPDATGHPAGDAMGGGTVGNSGDQGSPPASTDLDFVSDMAHPETG